MNPQDPNQPNDQPQDQVPAANPAPEAPQAPDYSSEPVAPAETPVAPVAPVETPAAEPAVNPFGPAPTASPASVETAAPNPFGAAPVSSDPATPVAAGPAPLGSAPGTPDQAPAPKKSNKKIGIIAGIVGGVVILAGVIVAVLLSMFSLSAADYKEGYDQLVTVRNAASETAGANIGVSASASEKLEETKKILNTFKTENAKLGDLKVFKADDELKTKYEAYKTKSDAFIVYTEALIPSITALSDAQTKISALGTGSSLFTSANIQKIIDAYKEVTTVSDPTVKAFAETAVSVYEEILPQAAILESSSSTTAQKLAASRAVSESTRKLTAQSRTMADDFKKKNDEVSFRDALNDLGDATTKKYNEKK